VGSRCDFGKPFICQQVARDKRSARGHLRLGCIGSPERSWRWLGLVLRRASVLRSSNRGVVGEGFGPTSDGSSARCQSSVSFGSLASGFAERNRAASGARPCGVCSRGPACRFPRVVRTAASRVS